MKVIINNCFTQNYDKYRSEQFRFLSGPADPDLAKARAAAERRGYSWSDVHVVPLPDTEVYDCGDHIALVVDSWDVRKIAFIVNWAIAIHGKPVEAFGVTMDAKNFDAVWGQLHDAVADAKDRHARMFCLRQKIVGYSDSEDMIEFTLENGWTMSFAARSQCCDASWFVLGDIEKPADLIGSVVTGLRNVKPDPEWSGDLEGDITYAFAVDTTRGTYTARMANDGGDSGCYNGELIAFLSMPGETFDPVYVNKGFDLPFNN